MTVANTILEQLGGARFVAMVGATNVLGAPNGVQFKIGRNGKGVTHVAVALTPYDDYVVRFFRARGHKTTEIKAHYGVSAEDLRATFERETGLYTSLGTMRGAS